MVAPEAVCEFAEEERGIFEALKRARPSDGAWGKSFDRAVGELRRFLARPTEPSPELGVCLETLRTAVEIATESEGELPTEMSDAELEVELGEESETEAMGHPITRPPFPILECFIDHDRLFTPSCMETPVTSCDSGAESEAPHPELPTPKRRRRLVLV